uniref:30S ribosomal protein S6, chloroplastic n=1 Tax=Pyropia perforata TaxID=182771 RepID=A0A023I7I7_PYRPE|nr:30S ribosomal protein S6 [Neoporphyra perforata]AGV01117.1 30S ribosomal protein S6 [Neoporphyra perforata]AHB35137.1 30S ribosomal protein S6 [Neoporphyra perforata]AHB35345.1 30S ribosomal protein S6 [Neoporphyra perforata]AIA19508.1 30S ribosomal protein S6 [Neoporphyra perforata]AIA19717.1 30S ribosomal protein S6 [Neoporphyra perforata]
MLQAENIQDLQLTSYETVYILKSDLNEDITLSVINDYKSMLTNGGAKNIVLQHRGRRHLSYPINDYHDGIYVQVNYEGNGQLVQSFEKSLRFDDNVIRYLTNKQKINIKIDN